MGGHGEVRLAGPDTAISVQGIPGRLHELSRQERAPRILLPADARPLFPSRGRGCFRFRTADRTDGRGKEKKSPSSPVKIGRIATANARAG